MTDSPEAENARSGERIAKLLARAGIASRREIERMIADGRVKLDGAPVTTPATLLDNLRGVTVDDRPVKAPDAARLFLFHKPSGLITAERDPAGRPTIYNALRNALPPGTPRVMPVGRLDLNTEGLLLLTNDGELKRALELPSSGVPRTYRARTFGDITQDRLEELIEGVEIDGIRYGKIDANMERRTGRNQWIELTLTEGKNREVRRVLEHLGLQVSRLMRISYGPFILGDLPRGMAGEIAPAEVEKFRRTLGLAAQDAGTLRRTLRVGEGRPRAEPEGRRRSVPGKPARGPVRAEGPRDARRPARAGKPGDARSETRNAASPDRRVNRRREDDGPLLGREDLRGRRGARARTDAAPRGDGRSETGGNRRAAPGRDRERDSTQGTANRAGPVREEPGRSGKGRGDSTRGGPPKGRPARSGPSGKGPSRRGPRT